MRFRTTAIAPFLLFCSFSLAAPGTAAAQSAATSESILKKLESMEAEIQSLKTQLKNVQEQRAVTQPPTQPAPLQQAAPERAATSAPASTVASAPAKTQTLTSLNEGLDPGLFGMTYRSTDALRFGAYGEVKFGEQQTEDGWRNGFDAGRVVLLGTYALADDIAFNTEIEFEHGGIAQDEDDKLTGAVEIEQVFVDFKFNDYINWRAPGVDIVPFGYVGLFHEPTQFYSVNRPELYNGLIPATWFEGATSIYGKVADNLTYQFQVSSALEDAGSSAPDSDSTVPEEGYDPGISGTEALGLSRASISDRKQLSNNVGYALRLAYTPPAIPGLGGSTSVYYTSNTSPRGAFGTLADGTTVDLGASDLTMVDTELRYRMPETGFEARAEYAEVFFGDPAHLRANSDQDPTNNVGDDMYGFSVEAAYHLDLSNVVKDGWELVPFYRYTQQSLQRSGFEGNDENEPSGAGYQQFHTFGAALFPTPKLVLKLDYQRALDDASDSPKSDHFFGAVGYFF